MIKRVAGFLVLAAVAGTSAAGATTTAFPAPAAVSCASGSTPATIPVSVESWLSVLLASTEPWDGSAGGSLPACAQTPLPKIGARCVA